MYILNNIILLYILTGKNYKSERSFKLGFLASHEGTNVQSIIDGCKSNIIRAIPSVIISNNSQSGVLQRAKKANIPNYHVSAKQFNNECELDATILKILQTHNVNLVILAGYMKKLGDQVLDTYKGNILNIHPSILPKFGGKGMYGDSVHQAVLNSGDKKTGVSIHLVTKDYDEGPIIAHTEITLTADETIESLKKKVQKKEHQLYIETLRKITFGELIL